MKTLIIDRDAINAQMMTGRLSEMGQNVVHEKVKSDGIDRLSKEAFDVVFIDPTPLKDFQAMTLNIKRIALSPLYLILMVNEDEDIDMMEAMRTGYNDFIRKPVDPDVLKAKIKNARNLDRLGKRLADGENDYPSAGGVIAKSAFNQLFLSAMDRGGRYEELTYVLSFAVTDYTEMKDMDGKFVADFVVSNMAQNLVRLRRITDIIGQTDDHEYSLLLQRTKNESEALEAANRFAASFEEEKNILPDEGKRATIEINLLHLPTGRNLFSHEIVKTKN